MTRFRATHGASTTQNIKSAQPSWPKRRRNGSVRMPRIAGNSSAGTKSISSARTSVSAAQAKPTSAARVIPGDRMWRTIAKRTKAIISMAGVSDITIPLGIQKSGASRGQSCSHQSYLGATDIPTQKADEEYDQPAKDRLGQSGDRRSLAEGDHEVDETE